MVNFMREVLANLQHQIWSDWMKWMFGTGTFNADGTWTMPKVLVDRWQRQMNLEYEELLDVEQDNDRFEADKIIKLFDSLGLTDDLAPREVKTEEEKTK